MTDSLLPELSCVTTTRDLTTSDGPLPAGTLGTIVHVYGAGAGYEVEFSAPWHCVTLNRADVTPHK